MYQAVRRWSVGESEAETSPPETCSEMKVKQHSLLSNLRIKYMYPMVVSNRVMPPVFMGQSYLHLNLSPVTLLFIPSHGDENLNKWKNPVTITHQYPRIVCLINNKTSIR